MPRQILNTTKDNLQVIWNKFRLEYILNQYENYTKSYSVLYE